MKKLKVFLLSTAIILFSISCEIGLGSSIDTESPTLEITNPPADATIRDSFAILGKWNDDGEIASVSVTMSRLDNNAKYNYNGTFTTNIRTRTDGSWTVPIDPIASKLTDGAYEAMVIITDNGGHKTTMARSFKIDNTPPLMLLSRPSISDGETGFDSYGRTFSIEGKAADDSDVNLIEVNIYDENNNLLTTDQPIILENIPLTVEKEVARYEADAANIYAQIYGHTDAEGKILPDSKETENRYCTLTIYDKAQRYPADGSAQSGEDKKGNAAHVYYKDSILAEVFDGKYTTTDLYHILNGTKLYDENRSAAIDRDDIVEKFAANEVVKSKFSINPANNPKYNVTSTNAFDRNKDLDDVDYQITSGNRYLEVEVSPGLDGYEIRQESISIYLKECEKNGEPKAEVEPILIVASGSENHKLEDLSDSEIQALPATTALVTKSSKTYKFKTSKILDKQNYPELKTGTYYRVYVDGHDSQIEDGDNIISDAILYAFKFIASGEKIELTGKGSPDYISKNAAAWVNGEKYIDNKYTVTLNWKGGEGPYRVYRVNPDFHVNDVTGTTTTDVLTWEQLKALGSGDNFPTKIEYVIKNAAGDTISTTATITLNYETEEPQVSNVKFTNAYPKTADADPVYIKNDNSDSDKNKCTITGIATDGIGIESVKLYITDDAGHTINETYDGTDKNNFKFENVDFTGFTVNPTVAEIRVTDNAGNLKNHPLNIIFDTSAPLSEHKLDAKEKDIIFRIGNYDNDEITSTEDKDKDVGGKYSKFTYGNSETIKIRGQFADQDIGSASGSGIDLVYYKVFHSEEDLEANIISLKNNYKTEADGSFGILEGSDIIKKRVFYSETYTKPGETTPVTVNYGTSNEDGKYYLDDVESNFYTTISGLSSDLNNGVNYLVLIPVDNVGNAGIDVLASGKKYYTLNVDAVPPEITSDIEEIKYSNGTQTIIFTGKVFDTLAGVDSMEVYASIPKASGSTEKKKVPFTVSLTDNGSAHPATSNTDITDEIKNQRYKKWTATIDTTKLKYDNGDVFDGTVSIYAASKDKAGSGNTSTVSVGTIIMDITGPEITLNPPASADKYSDDIRVNGNISLSGTAKDLKGLDESDYTLTLYYSETENGTYTQIRSIKNATNWTFENINADSYRAGNLAADASQEIWFRVSSKDVSGNTGYSNKVKVIVDPQSDRPVISFSNITVKDDMSSAEEKRTWITSSQVRGLAEDDDGVEEFRYSFDGSTWSEDCYNKGNKEFTINLPTDGSIDDHHQLYFKVKESGTNKEYITKAAASSLAALNTPKLLVKDSENNDVILGNSAGKYDTTLYVNIDLVNPGVPVIAYTMDDCSAYFAKTGSAYTKPNLAADLINNTTNTAKDSDTIKWGNLASSIRTGGPAQSLYLLVKAEDANGIDTIKITDGSTEITGESKRLEQNGISVTALFKIDVSTIIYDDNHKISVIAKDKADRQTDNSFDKITIDRKAPEISISSPKANETVYGNEGVADNRVTVSGRADDKSSVKKVFLAVTKSENDTPQISGTTSYKEITTENALAIVAVFNGDTENPNNKKDEYFEKLFNTYVDALYGAGTTNNSDRQDVCLWFYAEDEFGNSGKTSPYKLPLTVLTQGDKPEVEIAYPKEDKTYGGTITISGSTTIATDTVDKVYIQIDPDYNGSAFASNWKAKLESCINGRDVGYTAVQTGHATSPDGKNIEYAIEAQGSAQSWYLTTNMISELNKKDNQGNLTSSQIAIRAFAVGKNNHKISNVQELHFKLDPGAPVFGNRYKMRLVQYENNSTGSGDETASLLYQEGMWIQGKWWLTGSVEDDSGIETLNLVEENESDNASVNIIATSALRQELSKTANPAQKDYLLKIPVGVSGGTDVCYGPKFRITAKENGGSNTEEFKVELQCDNTPPVFSASRLTEGDDETNSIIQSDGIYSMEGTFDDDQGSGFKRIVLYITRELNGTSYLTDYMSSQGISSDGIPLNCYDIAANGFTSPASDIDFYWQKISNCTANNMEITLPSGSQLPAYVHDGCLCRINNVLYLIESANAASGVITLDTAVAAGASGKVDVEFTVAQIIDNTVSETGRTTTFDDDSNRIANDDGDKMVESYTKSTKAWTVAINSNNIKDGVIKLHFVAFDAAGNAVSKKYNGTVSNNRPRIAGVKFGSDIDGSGTVEDLDVYSEMKKMFTGLYNKESKNKIENVTVNGQSPNGNKIYTLALPNDGDNITVLSGTPVLTVKGNVTILPEIVGGNDGLSWSYCVGTKSDENIVKGSDGKRKLTVMSATHSSDIRTEETPINLSIGDILGVVENDGITDFHFQIWDHTVGTEWGYTSNRADLSLRFYVALNDGEAPEASINPFYWKSSSDNSIYYEKSGSKKIAKGHIELEGDLPDTFNATTGLKDKDPKLSGIVYLEGVAKDNVVVEELYLSFPGLTDGFVQVAAREHEDQTKLGQWLPKTSLADGYEFISVTEETETADNGQDYNVVNWKIAIDTAKIENVADTDIDVQVKVKDRGGAKSDGTFGEDIQEASSTAYKVDVVPYITGIDTALKSKLKSSIKAAYIRTALGHYIVRSDETLTIKGYNLGSDTKKPYYGSTQLAISNGAVTLPVSLLSTSGPLSLTVNGKETLNNLNNNNACGSYKTATTEISESSSYEDKAAYAYNRMPNRTSNNLLTDDVVFDVWYFDSDAAIPMSGELREPVMRINPVTGKVGLAFVSGPGDVAMAYGVKDTELGKEDKSYYRWQTNYATYNNISFAYDALGNSHGTATGLDTNPNSAHAGRFSYFYGRWTPSTWSSTGNYEGKNAMRLECIAVPNRTFPYTDSSGTQKNVQILVKGEVPSTHSLTETRFYSPSLATTVHENNGVKTPAVYLAYYDSIQSQIRFRFDSSVTATQEDTSNNSVDYKVANDNFVDNIGYKWKEERESYQEAKTEHFSLIAGADYQQGEFTRKSNKDCLTGYDTKYKANKYVCIDAINGSTAATDVVVAVWYDGKDCRYAYNDNPTSGKDNGTAGGWKGNQVIFSEGGEHCAIKVDPAGHIHIAAYVDGALRYAYLDSYSSVFDQESGSVLIDSFTITGERISIDAGLVEHTKSDGTKVTVAVPYITYFNGTSRLPTIARLEIPEDGVMDYTAAGTDEDDVFTGKWEISLVPSPKTLTVMYYDKMNVGLWKQNGMIVASNNSGFTGTAKNYTSYNNNSSSTDSGHIFGNGTANPILGYAVESTTGTCFETAQMK